MKRSFWVREKIEWFFHVLTRDLQLFDREYYFRFIRKTQERYEHLLSAEGLKVHRQATYYVSPPLQVSVSLS